MTTQTNQQKVEKIKALRQEAAAILCLNNAIADQIWRLSAELSQSPEVSKPSLQKQINMLQKQVETEGYVEKIKTLKEKIYKLEIQATGESGILSHSPKPGAGLR